MTIWLSDDPPDVDDVDDRLGNFDAFLTEAQADGLDGVDTDPSYQIPMIVDPDRRRGPRRRSSSPSSRK